MSHHIKPVSVMQYLSGIINTLEPHFPHVRKNRHDILVTRTLAGMRKLRGFTGTHRKRALTEDDFTLTIRSFRIGNLEDLLFIAIVFSSFHALLRLGKNNPTGLHVKALIPESHATSLSQTDSLHLFVRSAHAQSRSLLRKQHDLDPFMAWPPMPSATFHGLSRCPRRSLPLSCPALASVNRRGPFLTWKRPMNKWGPLLLTEARAGHERGSERRGQRDNP